MNKKLILFDIPSSIRDIYLPKCDKPSDLPAAGVT